MGGTLKYLGRMRRGGRAMPSSSSPAKDMIDLLNSNLDRPREHKGYTDWLGWVTPRDEETWVAWIELMHAAGYLWASGTGDEFVPPKHLMWAEPLLADRDHGATASKALAFVDSARGVRLNLVHMKRFLYWLWRQEGKERHNGK